MTYYKEDIKRRLSIKNDCELRNILKGEKKNNKMATTEVVLANNNNMFLPPQALIQGPFVRG